MFFTLCFWRQNTKICEERWIKDRNVAMYIFDGGLQIILVVFFCSSDLTSVTFLVEEQFYSPGSMFFSSSVC